MLIPDAGVALVKLALAAGFLSQAGQPIHGWQTPDGYKTDAATWLAITRGEKNPAWAVLKRKVRIRGPVRHPKTFQRCFPV